MSRQPNYPNPGYAASPYGGYGRGDGRGDSAAPPSGYAPHPQPMAPPSNRAQPVYRWWIPAEGIRRDVITADIQRYLGPDSYVKPQAGERGERGYAIAGYRTLTPTMIEDLKNDSRNFESQRSTGARYEESQVHASRHHYGSTEDQMAAQDHDPRSYREAAPPANSYYPSEPAYNASSGAAAYGAGREHNAYDASPIPSNYVPAGQSAYGGRYSGSSSVPAPRQSQDVRVPRSHHDQPSYQPSHSPAYPATNHRYFGQRCPEFWSSAEPMIEAQQISLLQEKGTIRPPMGIGIQTLHYNADCWH